jgi:nucleoside 2-deoxyribosyltransferase
MLHIVGGTYNECCMQPAWDELFGSGLRAVLALSGKTPICFHTFADSETRKVLTDLSQHLSFNVKAVEIAKTVDFYYEHPLASPTYFPQEINFAGHPPLVVEGDNIICFGMVEGNPTLHGNKVVYDPQDPGSPKSFRNNGSTANELVVVMNLSEASLFCSTDNIGSIKDYLFSQEKVHAAIIKNGPEGGYLLEANQITAIPAFQTDRVWPIGSGDIFTSLFGYAWLIQNKTFFEAALQASRSTAFYVNSKTLPIPENYVMEFSPFQKRDKGQRTVYLAGPFFNMGQRWVINQFREALLKVGLCVFSPLHDVGIGSPEKVAPLDLEGIDKADLLLVIADGLDTGTMFEAGYAKAKGKPILVFVENEKTEALTMLKGSNFIFDDDFTSIIYKTLWQAYHS